MFLVKYSNKARRFLKKADKILAKRLLKKIEKIKEKPILHDTKIVEGAKELLYRVRVGDYRILYEVDNKGQVIGIVNIDKRPRAYK
jgi:mRNA interferase RelE/StbE